MYIFLKACSRLGYETHHRREGRAFAIIVMEHTPGYTDPRSVCWCIYMEIFRLLCQRPKTNISGKHQIDTVSITGEH